jgi:hypothetical protein
MDTARGDAAGLMEDRVPVSQAAMTDIFHAEVSEQHTWFVQSAEGVSGRGWEPLDRLPPLLDPLDTPVSFDMISDAVGRITCLSRRYLAVHREGTRWLEQ